MKIQGMQENKKEIIQMIKAEDGILTVDGKPFLYDDDEHKSKKDFILNIYKSSKATTAIIEGAMQLDFAEKFSFFVGRKMSFKEIIKAIE